MDPLQTCKDLEEAPPEQGDIVDCRGWGCVGEKLAQIPAVGMLQYQRERTMLLERSVELDDVGRWAGAEPQQRNTFVVVGGFVLLVVIDLEDKCVSNGTAVFIL